MSEESGSEYEDEFDVESIVHHSNPRLSCVPYRFIQNYRAQCAGHNDLHFYSDYVLIIKDREKFCDKDGKLPESVRKAYSETISDILSNALSPWIRVELGFFDTGRMGLYFSCPIDRIEKEYLASKVNDYLHGIRVPDIENLTSASSAADPEDITFTTAERLRLVYDILTGPKESGGLEINMANPWFECLYPVHDRKFNQAWLNKVYSKWRVDFDDLTLIRNHFGEELAYYFAFIDFYFAWLIAPAIFGLAFYLFSFNPVVYGILNLGWATIFLEAWSRRQSDLAVRWEVVNASKVEEVRPEFRNSTTIRDPVTGELKPVASFWSSHLKKLASIPIVVLLGAVLGSLVVLSFVVEIIIVDFYSGPFKRYLGVLPSVVYMLLVSSFSSLYLKLANRLTMFENHRTETEHSAYFAQKVFVVNFLVSYLSIFLIAWVYIPYGDEIADFLKAYLPLSEALDKVGLVRLQAQIFFYVVTSQAINFFTETVLPLVMRYGGRYARNLTKKAKDRMRKAKNDGDELSEDTVASSASDDEVELIVKEFRRIEREYYELVPYTTYEDYAEMAVQFGYIVLFSVVFPLAPLVGLLNNWVELRSDFVKIVLSHRRLVPKRVENIGPWMGKMSFLVWLASIVNGLLIYQFSTIQLDLEGYHLLAGLVVAILWEHGWLLFSRLVRSISSNIPTYGEQITLKETYQLKVKLLGQSAQVYS